jgi:hypothetical protein
LNVSEFVQPHEIKGESETHHDCGDLIL